MSALTPGLYRATVRGISGESIVLVGNMNATFSLTPDGDVRRCYVFTDARPLIVLDLNGWRPQAVAEIPKWLRGKAIDAPSESAVRAIADQIEAQTKPPKPAEPKGVGAVIKAMAPKSYPGCPVTLVRGDYTSQPWHAGDFRYGWDQLEVLEVLSEGVAS